MILVPSVAPINNGGATSVICTGSSSHSTRRHHPGSSRFSGESLPLTTTELTFCARCACATKAKKSSSSRKSKQAWTKSRGRTSASRLDETSERFFRSRVVASFVTRCVGGWFNLEGEGGDVAREEMI